MADNKFVCCHCKVLRFPRTRSHWCPVPPLSNFPWCEPQEQYDARMERKKNGPSVRPVGTATPTQRRSLKRQEQAFGLIVDAIENGQMEAARRWFESALYQAAADERAKARQ